MNQEIGFASGLSGQIDKQESSEPSFASIKKKDLELINLWKEKVSFKGIIYII